MTTKKFLQLQFKSSLPILIGYLFLLGLIWLLSTLYYLPDGFIIDIIRFSLPILIVWEIIDGYRSAKHVHALQNDHEVSLHDPVAAQLLDNYRSQKRAGQKALRDLNNRQQEQLDHVELYSHEIKNSLTSLQAAAENTDQVPSATVIGAVRQANDQLNMLLSDERLAMTNNDFNFEWISLIELVSDLLKQNSAVFIHQQLLPQLELDNIQVLTDRKWLRFCVYQLLSNAIKYSPSGATIRIRWHDNSLQIIDHGAGISAGDLPRIYENGFSGHNGHQTTKSTGMGLYLVNKVTQQLNFKLAIQSSVDYGTTASLVFAPENVRLRDHDSRE